MDAQFSRKYADIPNLDTLSVESRQALRETDDYLAKIDEYSAASFSPDVLPGLAERDIWKHLEHDLSFAFDPVPTISDTEQVAAVHAEKIIATRRLDDFRGVMGQDDANAFIDFLNRCCEDFSLPLGIREGIVRTSSSRGGYVVYPPAEGLRFRLAEIFELLRSEARESPLFRSSVAMVLITNAHPFVDGNGRLSRVISQLSLWRDGVPTAFYLPWHIFFHRSRGGILLSVREAELRGNWDGLLRRVCRGVISTATRSTQLRGLHVG